VQNTTDTSGKPVKAPGIVCVQGSDSDSFQQTLQTPLGTGDDHGLAHGANHLLWWMHADIAPSCVDLALNGA
jgi:hypothetical protein